MRWSKFLWAWTKTAFAIAGAGIVIIVFWNARVSMASPAVFTIPRILQNSGQQAPAPQPSPSMAPQPTAQPSDAQRSSPLQPSSTPSGSAAAQPSPTPNANSVHGPPAFLVMIDPAHGGDDHGAMFTNQLEEKDVNLALARRLKSELQERGIIVRMSREEDFALSLEQRAQEANEQHASIYVALHAGMPGGGVRVYMPAFPSAPPPSTGKFMLWDAAQMNSLTRSRELTEKIAAQLAKRNVAAVKLASTLRPLNNVSAPAVAVELAPDPSDVQSLMAPRLQSPVAAGIAAGIAQLRAELEDQP